MGCALAETWRPWKFPCVWCVLLHVFMVRLHFLATYDNIWCAGDISIYTLGYVSFVDNTYSSYLKIFEFNTLPVPIKLCYTTRLHLKKKWSTQSDAPRKSPPKIRSSTPWLQNILRSRGHGELRADHPAAAGRGAGSVPEPQRPGWGAA